MCKKKVACKGVEETKPIPTKPERHQGTPTSGLQINTVNAKRYVKHFKKLHIKK
jgi:hypothetical protein